MTMIPSDKTNYQLHLSLWIVLGLVLFTTSACNRSIYIPNEAYLMGISEKGDLKVSASLTNSSYSYRQVSFAAAYSPIKHFSIVASQANTGDKFNNPLYKNWRVRMNEVALGFYNKQINPKTDKKYFLYDVYVGIGRGKVVYDYDRRGKMSLVFRRQFVQNNLHFWLSPHFGISLGARFARVNYMEGELFGAIPARQTNTVGYIRINNPFFTVEPSLQITGGFPGVKCFLSITSLGHTKRNLYQFGQTNKLSEGLAKIGLILEIDELIWETGEDIFY